MTSVLLDTHALIWWLAGSAQLSLPARAAIESRHGRVSAASAWEVSTKARIGKLPGALHLADDFAEHVRLAGFEGLPITLEHAQRAGALPGPHRDPFDRMLIAQVAEDDLVFATVDPRIRAYDIRILTAA